jgi:hypothetical protein
VHNLTFSRSPTEIFSDSNRGPSKGEKPSRGTKHAEVGYNTDEDTRAIIQGLLGSPAAHFDHHDHEMADLDTPTSPIAASIERMIAKKTVPSKKRKFVQLTDTEEEEDRYGDEEEASPHQSLSRQFYLYHIG